MTNKSSNPQQYRSWQRYYTGRATVVIFVLVGLNTLLAVGQNKGGIQLEGLVTATYSSRSNILVGAKTARFEACIEDCSWRIRVEYLQSYKATDKYFECIEAYGDGTNIFGVRPSNQAFLNSNEIPKTSGPKPLDGNFSHSNGVHYARGLGMPTGTKIRELNPKAVAWAIPSQVFRDDFFDVASPVWLAYASKCLLRSNHEDSIEPFISFGLAHGPLPNHRSGIAKPVAISRSAGNPERISQIVLFADGFPAAPAFANKKFTNVLYQAVAYTNLYQSWIVTRAKMSVLLPTLPSKHAQGLIPVVEYEVILTNVAYGRVPTRPALPKETFVNDYRLKESGLITYFSQNGDWLDTSELLTSDLVIGKANPMGAYAVDHRPNANRSMSRAFVIILPMVSLVIVILLVRLRGNKKLIKL